MAHSFPTRRSSDLDGGGAVGALVLLLWIPLRQRPGVGTVSNVIVVGLAVDVALDVVPAPGALSGRIAFLVAGVVANGVATGLYIGAGLGPGPRDGLMTGFVARHPRWSIRLVRTVIEVTVLGVGFLLGGTVGFGTIAYALAIGPLAHIFIPMFTVRPSVSTPSVVPGVPGVPTATAGLMITTEPLPDAPA